MPSGQLARYVADASKIEVVPGSSPPGTLAFRPLVDQPGPVKLVCVGCLHLRSIDQPAVCVLEACKCARTQLAAH